MTPQMTETNLKDIDTTEISNQLRTFSNLPLITRKCIVSLNSLVLLYTKEDLSEKILNQYFTTILKSFQSKESYLKFMTHFVISKIGKDTSDSFLSISSLLKDITDNKYKESGLKALFSVIPDQMLNDYKPVLVQGYVSRQEEVENISACIYYSLLKSNIAEKWITNPSTDSSRIKMALNFEIKKNDKNYLAGMLNHSFKDSRGVFQVKVAFFLYSLDRKKDEFVKESLKLKYNQEMIFVEACKQLINLGDEDVVKFINLALSSLKTLLKNKNQVIKFTAIKLLNQLAKRFPQQCEILSEEVEELINDSNKNISVLATTTILLIGSEESAGRLINKVSLIFSTLTEVYKTFLVEAVTKLLKKFKSKRSDFVSFYKIALEEKGSFEFKTFLLKNVKEIIHTNREEFLRILSFYIEDSLNYKLTICVLNILAEEIPFIYSDGLSKNYLIDNFLVHIFNRLILENNHVRIAALECLTNISKYIDFIQEDVKKLLIKFTRDSDLSETALFLLQTYEINGEKLSKNELNELNIKKEEKQGSYLIKECREMELSEKNADVKIAVKKSIYSDYINLSFKIENMLSGILIKEGIFSLAVFYTDKEIKKEYQFEFESLKNNTKKEFNISIRNEELLLLSNSLELDEIINVNSVIDYLLCPENDFTELEKESITCLPFQISFIDYFTPCFITSDLSFSSSSSFILDCEEINEGLQKILQIFNLQLVSQCEEGGEVKCVLEGKYFENEVRIVVEMWRRDGVNVNLDVIGSCDGLADKVIKLFE